MDGVLGFEGELHDVFEDGLGKIRWGARRALKALYHITAFHGWVKI